MRSLAESTDHETTVASAGDEEGEPSARQPLASILDFDAFRAKQAMRRQVTPRTMARLGLAQNAINFVRATLAAGVGNQQRDVYASRGNAYFRSRVADDDTTFWTYASEDIRALAKQHPESAMAARSEIAQGGSCDNMSAMAYAWIRTHAKRGTHVSLCTVAGVDHMFPVIGNTETDAPIELVVAEAWTNEPKAVTWADHWCNGDGKQSLRVEFHVASDHVWIKDVIKAGLTLNDAGRKEIAKTISTAELDKRGGRKLWQQDDADRADRDVGYTDHKAIPYK